MLNFVIIAQILAIFLLFAELLYVVFQKPSKMQVLLSFIVSTTMIMLVGYLIEIRAANQQEAMAGVAMAYIGKPFAMMATTLFVAEYCGRPVGNRWTVLWAVFCALFPALIYTNRYHYLYYSCITFDRSRPFSPLRLGHGPFYYLYMVFVAANFILVTINIIHEYRRCTTREARHQALYILSMCAFSILGYVVFLTGMTAGYDTTMAGAVAGVACLSILFFRYHLFDSLTYAKDQALDDSVNGLLVFDSRDQLAYHNEMVQKLLDGSFTLEELRLLPQGNQVIQRGDRVYEVDKHPVAAKGRSFGETVEISDITDRYLYSSRLEADVENRTREIQRIQRSVITSFAGIVEARDHATGAHIKRVSTYVGMIARDLKEHGVYTQELTEDFITRLEDVAPLHDIGKVSISDIILNKPGRLTDEEFEIMKTHTVHGAEAIVTCLAGVEQLDYVTMAKHVALYHHEKWNGRGYPEQKAGQDIPLCARITAVADVFDAVRSERCYKPPMDLIEARKVIEEGRGTNFDPQVVDAFLRLFDQIAEIA